MAYGGWDHNKIQFGRESVKGTAVPATTIWRGPFASLQDARTVKVAEEQIGLLVSPERTYTTDLMGKLAMPAADLTFEQVIHILEASIASPTPGAGPAYKRIYATPTDNSLPTHKTYTLEAYNVQVTGDYREMAFAYVESFEFSGEHGDAWKCKADWVGQGPVAGTATSLSTLVNVESALVGKTIIYIDDSGGTLGTTQKSNVLMGATIQCNSGIIVVPTSDGLLQFSALKYIRPTLKFTIKFELEGTTGVVAAERAKFEADALRLIQLKCTGATNKEFTLRMSARYDSIGSYENSDGNTTVTIEGHAAYSAADSLFFAFDVSSGLATIT